MRKETLRFINTASTFLLIIALLVSLISLFGTTAIASWDGTIALAFSSGSGTAADPYVIQKESQFGYFINQLNKGVTYDGLHITLMSDLDMTGNTWTYNNTTASFNGILDGNCHTITTDSTLLPDIGTSGTVKKINAVANQTTDDSLLCIDNNGSILACTARGTLPSSGSGGSSVGLICQYNYGTVQYCGAVGSTSAYGDDTDSYSGMIAINKGTIDSCFAAVTPSGSAPGKYNDAYNHPIANGYIGTTTTASNSYYDKTLYRSSSTFGTGLTTEEMQSAEFLQLFAGNTLAGTQWIRGNDGYPTLATCGTSTVSIEGKEGSSVLTYHSTNYSASLVRTGSGTIYYTTDGSDPRSSSAQKSTSSFLSVPITGDMVLSAAVYSNGQYGSVSRCQFVYLPGRGTADSPYQIRTKLGLNAVRLDPAACYKLTTDLTYTDADFAFGGVASGGWTPIPSFTGTFDGDAHAITGLKGTNGGLIDTNEGTITSLRMLDHKLYDANTFDTGPIANSNSFSGTITRCYARSAYSVTEQPSTTNPSLIISSGGIVGSSSGTVSYCAVDGVVFIGAVSAEGQQYVGGIVGRGDTDNCVSRALIVCDDQNSNLNFIYAGGICASGYASNCWSDVDFYIDAGIDYDIYLGGIAGHFANGNAWHCTTDSYQVTTSSRTVYGGNLYRYTWAAYGGDSYNYFVSNSTNPSIFPELDFDTNWMVTDSGIFPQGVMDVDGHCYNQKSYTATGCTNARTSVLVCDLCKTEKTFTLDALGHILVTDAAVETSCSAPGKTEGKHCSVCQKVTVAQEEIPQLPHTYENGHCTVCQAEETFLGSGYCGDHLTWTLNDAGELVIDGTGAMFRYSVSSSAPWYTLGSSITNITLPDGITQISPYAFYQLENITEITLPGTVSSIGSCAFSGCSSLTAVLFTGKAPVLYGDAFESVTATVSYPLSYSGWDSKINNNYGGTLTWEGYRFDDELLLTPNIPSAETAGITLTAPEGGWKEGTNTFTVTCDNACVVAVSYDGGQTYTRLTATTSGDGCSFTADNITADTIIAVVLSGDANGDGRLTNADVTRARAAALGKITLDALQFLAVDVNNTGDLTNADATRLRAAVLGKTSLAW